MTIAIDVKYLRLSVASLPQRRDPTRIDPSMIVDLDGQGRATVRDGTCEVGPMPCWRCGAFADFPVDGLGIRPICGDCVWTAISTSIRRED